MRWIIGPWVLAAALALSACAPDDRGDALARISTAIGESADDFGSAGQVIFVESPRLPMSLSITRPASGGARFTPDATMRIASNTKTFVAVAALKLVEQGQLDLDAPISQSLPVHLQNLLSDGGYDVDAITARMLLQHTSGLADHAQLPVYFEQIMADPQRLWSREDQVSLAMSEGEAVGAPGERFAYSDTGYVLLGAIIENVHGAPMADAIRELSGIDQLGLRATWWEAFEPEPEGAPAPFPQAAFGLALSDISASVDLYGGGGLISNLDDLAQYHHAAASGALFEDATLNAALISPSPQSQANGQGGYGMGFFIREYAGETCYEHSGFWGTLAVYCPETDITVAAAVTDAEEGFRALFPLVEAAVLAAR
jgi:D-alanyl-D-alanine carboxypeptidase